MNTINDKANERREIEDLLPWHASGTLSRRDAERVEKALQADRELARRFELVREELAETILLNESLGAPSARVAEKLFAAIDAEPKRTRAGSLDLSSRFADFIASFSPRTLAWSATGAALAIVLQAAVLTGVLLKDQGGSDYSVASVDVGDTKDAYVLVRFAPGASAQEITKFLDEYRVMLLEPKPGGLFRARLAVTGAPKEALAAAVKSMQADTKVVGFVAASE
jgi:anti-sigma-K factor RskA